MSFSSILINGTWQSPENPMGKFQATDPSKKKPIPETFPISSFNDIKKALDASMAAVEELRSVPKKRLGNFLEFYAENITKDADSIVKRAAQETGLSRKPRLMDIELPRTIDQLKQAASPVREGSWCLPTIDTKLNIRSN